MCVLVYSCFGKNPSIRSWLTTRLVTTTEYLAMRLDRLVELLQDCLGVTSDGSDVLAKGDDMLDMVGGSDDMRPSINSVLDVHGVTGAAATS
jgi:hypothetical protein